MPEQPTISNLTRSSNVSRSSASVRTHMAAHTAYVVCVCVCVRVCVRVCILCVNVYDVCTCARLVLVCVKVVCMHVVCVCTSIVRNVAVANLHSVSHHMNTCEG